MFFFSKHVFSDTPFSALHLSLSKLTSWLISHNTREQNVSEQSSIFTVLLVLSASNVCAKSTDHKSTQFWRRGPKWDDMPCAWTLCSVQLNLSQCRHVFSFHAVTFWPFHTESARNSKAQFTQDTEHFATRARKLWNTAQSMGVFTQLASNIKGFARKFVCKCA